MHLGCRVCEHIDVNTCTCQAGPALFLWPRSTNTAHSIMLILTLLPGHPLMLHRPAPSSYLVTTRRPYCLVSRVIAMQCVVCASVWDWSWNYWTSPAGQGIGCTSCQLPQLGEVSPSSSSVACLLVRLAAAGAARRQLGRCGRGGAGRAGSSSVHHTPVWSQPPQCPHRRAQPGPARTCDTVIPLRTPQRACAFCQQPSRTAQTRSENKWKTFEKWLCLARWMRYRQGEIKQVQ